MTKTQFNLSNTKKYLNFWKMLNVYQMRYHSDNTTTVYQSNISRIT